MNKLSKCNGKHQNVQEIINCPSCAKDIDTLSASRLGKQGGINSAKSRFSGKSKSEISEIMKRVRLIKKDRNNLSNLAQEMADNLGKNVSP